MTDELVIVPFESFGPVRFGMTVAEVETVMGPPDAILESQVMPETHPQFSYHRFGRVAFTVDGRCDSVESYAALVDAEVNGIPLVGDADEVAATLVAAGHEVKGELDSYTCPSLGIELWRENPKESLTIDTVRAYR